MAVSISEDQVEYDLSSCVVGAIQDLLPGFVRRRHLRITGLARLADTDRTTEADVRTSEAEQVSNLISSGVKITDVRVKERQTVV